MDRTFRSLSGKILQPERPGISPAQFAQLTADALRRDFGDTHRAVKTICGLTGAHERAVKNWLQAKNGPAGFHLIALMQASDAVLESVLIVTGRRDLFVGKKLLDSKHELVEMLWAITDLEFDRIRVPFPDRVSLTGVLSQRQEAPMLDPADVIKTAIHSAFVKYPMEDDPDFNPHWIKPDECAHLTRVILMELEANGLQIVKKSG
jgi:hypothetical protein